MEFDFFYDKLFLQRRKAYISRSLKIFEELSLKHYTPALVALGYCYENGIGVRKNIKRAISLYTEAATHKSKDALYNLGIIFEHNKNSKNLRRAFLFYKEAALLGDAHAQTNLGSMYYNGKGCEKDYAQAKNWTKRAAYKGDAVAQYNLGLMYLEDEHQLKLGKKWIAKAAENGHKGARLYISLEEKKVQKKS